MFKQLNSFVGAVVLVFALAGASSAQVSNMGKIYPTFEVSTIGGILAEAGIPFQVSQLEGGTPFISAIVGPGQTILMLPTRCQSGPGAQCYSLLYMAIGNPAQLPYSSLGENLVVVNYLNALLDLAEIHINPVSDNPVVMSVLNSDHGVAKGNILATLGLQIQSTNYAFGEMASVKADSNTLSSGPTGSSGPLSGDAAIDNTPASRQPLQMVIRPMAQASALQGGTSKTLAPFQSMAAGGVVKSILEDPAFRALMATEDFQRDFGFQISD